MRNPFESMIDGDLRDELRKGLIESYKPKIHKDFKCAICGRGNAPVAMHVLENSIDEGSAYPDGFVPMSASRGRVRGSFPVCTTCAPVCKKCKLPKPTEKVLEYGHVKGVQTGLGICQHIQWGLLLKALIKRAFKKGRFSGR